MEEHGEAMYLYMFYSVENSEDAYYDGKLDMKRELVVLSRGGELDVVPVFVCAAIIRSQ